jgi:hypothetical protein
MVKSSWVYKKAEEFQGGNRGKHIGTEEGFWPEAL